MWWIVPGMLTTYHISPVFVKKKLRSDNLLSLLAFCEALQKKTWMDEDVGNK